MGGCEIWYGGLENLVWGGGWDWQIWYDVLILLSRELARAGESEVRRKLEEMAGERDATLTRAQQMSDQLVGVEKERDSLQVSTAQHIVNVMTLCTGDSSEE